MRLDIMLKAYEEVAPKRYREKQGLTYEQFEIGTVWEHRPGRTITEADNIWGSLLSMNQHPIHCDNSYAAKTEFGRALVNSAVSFAIVNGMTVASLSARAIANLGWDKVRLTRPVFVGDTLYAESTVLSKRLSRSRPNQGIVGIATQGINQDGEIVMTMERSFLVPSSSISTL